MEKVFAVDGDIIAYRTAAVCEDHFEGAGYAIIESTLKEIAEETNVTNMRIYLTGSTSHPKYPTKKDNFRYDAAITKPYKGNRATMERPKYLNDMYNYLVETKNAIIMDGYEADDGIATDMTVNKAIHCGIDKDILQVPGLHYNYVKKEWINVTEEEATLCLYRQILTGDTSDNIPGLPRIGVKKAEAAIKHAESAFNDALEFYRVTCKAKLPDVNYMEYFNEQSKLITMIRDIDYVPYDKLYIQEIDAQGFESHNSGFEGEDAVNIATQEVTEDEPKAEIKL